MDKLNRKIVIGSDHAGYALKEFLKKYLLNLNTYDIIDVGCDSTDSCDFSDFAEKLSAEILLDNNNLGIIICGSGIGVSIACNKVPGIRCALVHDYFTAKMCRKHNDANVIALGANVVGQGVAENIVEAFLSHDLINEEKYIRRIKKVEEIEKKYSSSSK